MKYVDGLMIGAATILAVLYAEYTNAVMPMCLSVGVCAGLALDWAVRAVLRAVRRS